MNFLTEHGIDAYPDLESRLAEISAASEEAAATLKTAERRLGEMAVLIKNVPYSFSSFFTSPYLAYSRSFSSDSRAYSAFSVARSGSFVTPPSRKARPAASYSIRAAMRDGRRYTIYSRRQRP